ncbi:MAG: hypothetical protein A2271_03195 [Candidatus Moranbacteria bacterium RIFOXYA12_FULL_35_19]|nr:MAG: hypothetical protein UR78_C0010G0025 [Candidatus Moranbacteria bacterium GW2011_GWF2_35_39]OGI30901.1 MAG: hypothetical protein A2343_02150 [Candidatus Moranbacteria bacterium RIFOXYB12_FULL_35_8]OGI32320.1 MAG: hypothetical protein A2489_03200 [Candidatus Moranbacteria bacterium RIFOXYC12_FULL_36_13]OGI36580.1 MAG: hypothetical protein A2271_03195 [Candidatus Moranbacteria bacterium RIFOXYA12_FULL_35_19]
MKKIFTKKRIILFVLAIAFLVGGYYLFIFAKTNKKDIAIKSLAVISKFSGLLPIPDDEKKELEVMNKLVEIFTKKDGVTRTFMLMLQNNMELRPGGGFLGQYAILKIKDGEVISTFFEDANLLDQRITAKITPPYPFTRMMDIKKWKFRDSNFSPDFPTNVEKAKYFYRLAGRNSDFDGVIAVNAEVFNDVLALTGPITVPGYGVTFNSTDGALKLEEYVEKRYIMNPEIDTQNRKEIMRKMAPIMVEKLFSLGNITKIAELGHKELQNRNIMINFKDPELQSLAESVYWDGRVARNWGSDYLMMVDANMGALKTDHYIKREVSYDIDLTTPKPTATLNIIYKNTATYGDWRTSDYHSYLRIYVPKGSNFLESKMVSYTNKGEDFDKTYFGFICHVLIGRETNSTIKYELPENFNLDDYRLLIQKQSGVSNIPFKVHLKTKDGEYNQEQILNKDLKFEFKNEN